ncbi:MAG: ankyrin repeat domain-containing protein, partial [Chlamydiales bacterium]|nr:ankyrin repeat domain-containing protein [Chlamydiales bacterium]
QEITVEETHVAHFETSTLSVGVNALHEAVCFNNTERVIELLECGYSVNGRDFASRTPVMIAARKGASAVFALLLARGAKILYKDMWGLTAMDWCAIQGKHDMLITSHNYAHLTPEYHHALALYKSRAVKYVDHVDPIQQIIEAFQNMQFF